MQELFCVSLKQVTAIKEILLHRNRKLRKLESTDKMTKIKYFIFLFFQIM